MTAPAIRTLPRLFSSCSQVAFRSFTRTRILALRAESGLACLAIFAGLAAVPAMAQTAHLSGGARVYVGAGFSLPNGVAVDSSGNVFVTDSGHAQVKEIQAPGYSTTVPIASLNGDFSYPTGIAIDTAGDLFVADEDNGTIKEIAAAGGYVTVSTIATGFAFPTGVAVDRDGNVYVADFGSNHLYELLVATSYSIRITIPVSFSALVGVAVDANGNLFTADENDGIQEIPAASGYQTLVDLASGNSNIAEPYGIGLDSSGNLYYTDLALGAVFEIFESSGYQTVVPVLGGLNEPSGVTVDALGDVFIAETDNSTVDEVPAANSSVVDFGSVPIGTSTPPTQTLTFEFDSPGKVQAPLALTQGVSGQDFKVEGGTCAAATYAAGETCTVTLSFTPNYAGLRLGALELVNSSGAPFVTIYASGTGTGPQIAFLPGTQSTLGSGFSAPQGVAADGAGNVFVADTANNEVKEVLASGGYTAVRLLGGGFNAPQGVAVDGVGNVFVADTGNNAVEELAAVDGYSLVTTLGSGFNAPTAVSVDGSGNIVVADKGNNLVKEILEAGGYTTVNTLPSNSTVPSNTEANVNGNLYIADTTNNRVLRQDQTTPPSLTFAPTLVGSTSADSPQTVTVSNIGGASLTFPIPSAGKNNASITGGFSLGSAGTCPDLSSSSFPAGTVASGTSCTYLVSFSPATAGPFDGSLVLTDNNLNASLTQTVALYGTTLNSQSIGFSPPSPVTYGVSPITLTASASSGLPVTLSVLSGPGTMNGNVLTVTGAGTIAIGADQAGNATYAPAQTSANVVVGLATQTIAFTPPTVVYPTSPITLSATGGASGNPVSFSIFSGPGSLSGTNNSVLTVTGAGTIVIAANQAGNTDYSAATQVTQSIVVDQLAILWIGNPGGSTSAFLTTGAAYLSNSEGGIGVAIDSSGNVWSLYAGGDRIAEFSSNGAPTGTTPISGHALTGGASLAIDGSNQVWIPNSTGGTLAVFNSGGTQVTPDTGYTVGTNAPTSIAIDISGNVWIANSGSDSVTKVLGAAAPTVPLAAGVANGQSATEP